MLVITRTEGQSFYLVLPNGEEIKIRINEHYGNNIKIGIDAPDDVTILREELMAIKNPH